MSFLRKWGSSSGPATTGAGSAGATTGEAAKLEWFNETPGERYFGMENFGNTCYANSVLQSLYFSKPFRELVEAYSYGVAPITPAAVNSLLPRSASSLGSQSKSPGPASPPTLANSQPIKPTTSRTAGAAGGGRSGMFGALKRTTSVQGQEPASSAESTASANSSTNGAPLAQTLTQTSFTGVGTPQMTNGTLVPERPAADTTLLTTLHDLFVAISSQPKTLGTVAPQAFINQLKRDNEFFRSTLHQDAHEFLNYLVNMIAEAVEKEEKERADNGKPSILGEGFSGGAKTWVHKLFEGVLTNETRCLTCETVTSRDEAFLDLSIDIEQNSSVTACLRQFSASEMLCQRNKFSCDKCCGLQEAEKRMKIKKLPNILALHLKRFKYEESLQRHVKLTYRVVFPFELRLFNTADGVSNPDRLYELWAIVVHIGVGPHHGHYITIVKSGSRWIVFDDNNVYPIEEAEISKYFGDTPGQGSGYVLFYQAVDLDLDGLNLRNLSRERTGTTSSISTAPITSSTDTSSRSVESAPPPGFGLGLAMNERDSAIAHNTNPFASSQDPLDPTPSQDPAPPALSPFSAPSTAPASADAAANESRKSSVPSIASTEPSGHENEREAEQNNPAPTKDGWSIKGRKMSIGSRIGRSISLSSSNGSKETPRSVSSPMAPTSTTDLIASSPPPTQSTVQTSSTDTSSIPLAADRPFHPSHTPPEPATSESSSPSEQRPSPSIDQTPYATPLMPNPNHISHPPPPSDDGSVSTVSTQGLSTPSPNGAAPSPIRRGSRASVDLNNSSTTNSASSGGALAATRNFLSRKPRPQSTVAPSTPVSATSSPNPNGIGLGIARPPVRLPSSVSTNGTSTPLASLVGDDGGAALSSSPSVIVSKKDMEKAEKRLKEERKLREKEEKKRADERLKRLKEEERRAKEEAKKADKLRKKGK